MLAKELQEVSSFTLVCRKFSYLEVAEYNVQVSLSC